VRLSPCPAVLVALLAGAVPVEAHGTSASYVEVSLTAGRIEVAHLLAIDELTVHFPAGPDAPAQAGHAMPDVFAFLAAHVALSVGGQPVGFEGPARHAQARGSFVRFTFTRQLDEAPTALGLAASPTYFDHLGPYHMLFARVTVEDQVHQAIITHDRPQAAFSTGYRPLLAQCGRFLALGVEHIFLGYDHLVFLLALLIIGGRLGQLVATVSAFTVAHSLTLALAVLRIVELPARLVEGAIALTIAFVAFDNFFTPATRHRWLLTFCLGLVHGLGFATVLREMSLPASQLVPSLLSFNLGVEIGQIVVVAALFPLILWLTNQRFHRRVVVTASGAILLFGLGLFVQHAFGIRFVPT
jgi:hypothetical protein